MVTERSPTILEASWLATCFVLQMFHLMLLFSSLLRMNLFLQTMKMPIHPGFAVGFVSFVDLLLYLIFVYKHCLTISFFIYHFRNSTKMKTLHDVTPSKTFAKMDVWKK